MSCDWVRHTLACAAPCIAVHIEPHALIIKLGPLSIATYPYLGLLVFALFDCERGFTQYRGIECHYPPINQRLDHY